MTERTELPHPLTTQGVFEMSEDAGMLRPVGRATLGADQAQRLVARADHDRSTFGVAEAEFRAKRVR